MQTSRRSRRRRTPGAVQNAVPVARADAAVSGGESVSHRRLSALKAEIARQASQFRRSTEWVTQGDRRRADGETMIAASGRRQDDSEVRIVIGRSGSTRLKGPLAVCTALEATFRSIAEAAVLGVVIVDTKGKRIDEITTSALGDASTELVVWIYPRELFAHRTEPEACPGFDVQTQLAPGPFRVARTTIDTVLRNLIGNAVKHHDHDRGHIAVNISEDIVHCHFEVSDDGPGIPGKFKKRLFTLVQSVSNSKPKGLGMGLALAANDNARGSTFHMWWPRFNGRGPE
jgi:hypothetical protein